MKKKNEKKPTTYFSFEYRSLVEAYTGQLLAGLAASPNQLNGININEVVKAASIAAKAVIEHLNNAAEES